MRTYCVRCRPCESELEITVWPRSGNMKHEPLHVSKLNCYKPKAWSGFCTTVDGMAIELSWLMSCSAGKPAWIHRYSPSCWISFQSLNLDELHVFSTSNLLLRAWTAHSNNLSPHEWKMLHGIFQLAEQHHSKGTRAWPNWWSWLQSWIALHYAQRCCFVARGMCCKAGALLIHMMQANWALTNARKKHHSRTLCAYIICHLFLSLELLNCQFWVKDGR